MLEADLKTVYTELLDEAGLSLAEEQKNFFDYLHFSPIKVRHLNMVSNFFYELSVHKIYWWCDIYSNVFDLFSHCYLFLFLDPPEFLPARRGRRGWEGGPSPCQHHQCLPAECRGGADRCTRRGVQVGIQLSYYNSCWYSRCVVRVRVFTYCIQRNILSPFFFFHLSPSGQLANLRLDEVLFLNLSL